MPGHSPPSHTVPTTTNRNANASDTVLMSPRCGCNTTTSAAVATTATTHAGDRLPHGPHLGSNR